MATSTESVSVVIVNYRRYDLLAVCLASLMAGSTIPDDVVVVDNGSDPELLAGVAGQFPNARMLPSATNDGFAVACNRGWRSGASDRVLFLNADVTLGPDTLSRCMGEATSASDIGVLTCRLMRPDGTLDAACHRGQPTPSAAIAHKLRLVRFRPQSHRLGRYSMSWLDPRTDHDIEACCGAFMLVRRDVLEAVGGWDERYWFYGEDLDICLRISKLGYRVRYLGTVTAGHVKSASSYLRQPPSSLTPEQREHKLRVQRAIIDSHRLYVHEHFEPTSSRPLIWAIRGMLLVQQARLSLAARLADGGHR